jgi:hypothetical protein
MISQQSQKAIELNKQNDIKIFNPHFNIKNDNSKSLLAQVAQVQFK